MLDLLEKAKNSIYRRNLNKNKNEYLKTLSEEVINAKMPRVKEFNQLKDKRVIISLTSFPKRFDQLVLTIKSIILQKTTPNKIVVYLGSDTKIDDITPKMRELEKYGVEYRIDRNLNLKGHKKYFYALKEFKDYLVITIDDDIIFPNNMISELLRCYEKNPTAVCARRVHKITQKKGQILPYDLWDKEYLLKKKPSNRLIATTGAGTLYSPFVISHLVNDTFDSKRIINLCLEADDIWMKCMELLSSIKVVLADVKVMGTFIDVDEEYTLMKENVGNRKNDEFLKKVIKNYDIDKDLFIND